MSAKQNNEGFSSILGFILVTIGFAVGVGSFWRFPYVCGTNGGAIFILTYILVIILIGIPLLAAEITMGFTTQKTAVSAYKALAPGTKWHYVSYLHILVAVLIFSYTVPIYAWVLTYIWRTAAGFFAEMAPSDIEASFIALTGDYKTLFLFAGVNWAFVALVVQGGLQNGVEKLNKFLLPALAVIMTVCIVIGFQVEGAEKGLVFMFKPDAANFSMNSVTTAVGQAFFAIGIGMLAAMIFGSYIKNRAENIVRDSSVICFAIVLAGIASGLMIFPMVFAFGLAPTAGVGLSLITLPNVFNYIKFGRAVGCLFYIGFYFAAFSSAIGLCEAVSAVFMDGLGISRRKAVAVSMCIALAVGSAALVVPKFLDTIDMITSNYLLVLSGFAISVFVGWVWGVDNFIAAANIKSGFVKLWMKFTVKYLCPVAIAAMFMGNFM
ncbi:MAG: sodium-dependent transporter [bacterium]|nr:sodium-dependent transporter [bacterium]